MAYPPLLDAAGALAINAVGLILVPAALRSGADSGSVSPTAGYMQQPAD
jgi:hypothetical protein